MSVKRQYHSVTLLQKTAAPIALATMLAAASFAPAALPVRDPGREARPEPTFPSLVVLLVVDQMRADYVDRFRSDWTGGLKQLLDRGAWFSRAAYPYLNTVTCSGHATVSTGTFPRTNGIIQNAWYDRETRRQVTCTEDSNSKAVGYGVDPMGGDSSHRLLLPTFADQMRVQRRARVVTLSLKPRSAIMLAGRAGEAVTWLTSSLDGWQTSSAFSAAPVAAVQQFVASAPIAADFGKSWTPLLPASRYHEPDAGEREDPPEGWTASFPHVLNGAGKGLDHRFYEQWQHSPFADAYLGRFALALVESFQLGSHGGTDVLGIGFSSPDIAGHAFGPRSQEVRDLYAHLDRTIGALLDRLDARVGRDHYLVALTSDHGVGDIPEQLTRSGKSGGRVSGSRLRAVIENAAQAAGPGRYLIRAEGAANEVYFEPGMYERLQAEPAVLARVMKQIREQPGIAGVFRSDQLRGGASSPNSLSRAAALSYRPERSGDLLLALSPGWTFAASGASHGTANSYDQHVPLVLMGPNVKPGEYREPATPADLAPTLAALTGIVMPEAEGRVLRSALATKRVGTIRPPSPAAPQPQTIP